MASVQTKTAVPLVTTPPLDEPSRKRAASEANTPPTSNDGFPSSPTKRAKSEPPAATSLSGQMYQSIVKNALESLEKRGDGSSVQALTTQIELPQGHPEAVSPASLGAILKVLSEEVSRLDNRKAADLIRAILQYDWLGQDEQFVQQYSTFLTVLVSGIPKWFSDVANKIVADFANRSDSELPCHHKTLKYLIHISPASLSTIPDVLRANCPNKAASKETLVNYTENLLTLVGYCDDLRYPIWSLLVEKLITMDVELQNEIDDVDDEDLDEALDGDADADAEAAPDTSIAAVASDSDDDDVSDDSDDDDSDDSDDDDSDDSDDDEEGEVDDPDVESQPIVVGGSSAATAAAAAAEDFADDSSLFDEEEYNVEIQTITDLSGKLDSIMKIILDRTQDSFTEENLEGGDGVNLFSTLTSIFKTFVLPTHYTRCVQYLLFHMVQQQPELTDSFLVMLIDVVFNSRELTANRIKAMQYVSSFIARAKSLSREQLLSVVKYLMAWCDEYVQKRESEVGDGKGGMERFKILYCVLQGLMYIVCFRYKELKNEYRDDEWELNLDKFFNKMIMSKFNPLKYCNETVVLIFARIAQRVDLCYCFSLIEKNKRARLQGVRNPGSGNDAENKFESKQEFLDLEAYFPFDPLMLKKSKQIVNRNYIEWQSVDDSSEDSD